MNKSCELCGKPLDLFPNATPVMNGEERMHAWIVAILVGGCVMLASIIYEGCESNNAVEIARIQCAAKIEQAKVVLHDGGIH